MVAGIGANLGELVGLRMLEQHQQAQNRALERLSTGKRINRGKDDPAGLIAATHLGAQAAALRQNIEGLEIDSYRLGAKEGALSVIGDLAIELESAVIASANTAGTTKEEREAYQLEAESIIDGIHFILRTARFDGELIFEGQALDTLGVVPRPPGEQTAESGKDAADPDGDPGLPALLIATSPLMLDDLRNGGALSLVSGDRTLAQELVGGIRKEITLQRAAIGAQLKNFYEPQIRSLTLELEGTVAAQSKIEDADFAVEISEFVRSQVLAQAAAFVILRSRENAEKNALTLLG